MRVVELVQGGNEWLSWRKSKITASEIGIILGVSPYMTPIQLYEQKVGESLGQAPSVAMQRGLDLEPIARKLVCERFGLNLKPLVIEHDEHPYLAASLDGYDAEQRIPWEGKAPNKIEHAETEISGPPKKYYFQVQTQLMITGAEKLLYTTINGDHDLKHYWVTPDPTAFKEIKKAALEFYTNMKNGIPPELCDRDYVNRDDDEWKRAAFDYLNLKLLIDDTEESLKRAKSEVIRLSNNQRTRGCGVKIHFQKRRNPIDFNRVANELNVDLDKFRAPGMKTIPTITTENV